MSSAISYHCNDPEFEVLVDPETGGMATPLHLHVALPEDVPDTSIPEDEGTVLSIVSSAYKELLRGLLLERINDPDNSWSIKISSPLPNGRRKARFILNPTRTEAGSTAESDECAGDGIVVQGDLSSCGNACFTSAVGSISSYAWEFVYGPGEAEESWTKRATLPSTDVGIKQSRWTDASDASDASGLSVPLDIVHEGECSYLLAGDLDLGTLTLWLATKDVMSRKDTSRSVKSKKESGSRLGNRLVQSLGSVSIPVKIRISTVFPLRQGLLSQEKGDETWKTLDESDMDEMSGRFEDSRLYDGDS